MTQALRPRLGALCLIAALSVVSHFKGITAPPLDYHYHRQINTAAIARNYHENGLRFFTPQIDWAGPYRGRSATEFPLYMWLTGLFWSLFDLGELWGRLLSAGFCALAAVYLFLFLERRLEKSEALCAALLFSLSPLTVYFGRTIQPEALALAASIAAFYHWDRHLESGRRAGHWIAAVTAAALAIGHKIPCAYILLVLAALAWFALGRRALADWRVMLAPVVCLGGVVSWYLYAKAGPYVVPTRSDEFIKILDYGRLAFFAQFQLISRLPELVTTWPGMPFAAAGAIALWRRHRFFHLWWLIVAAYIVAGGGYTFYHEYTSLPFVPVMAGFMGVGLVRLWRAANRASTPWVAKTAVAGLVVAVAVVSNFRIKHWYGQNFEFLAKASSAADAVSRADDLFVCDERASSVYLYYLKRRGWSWEFAESDIATTQAKIDAAVAQGARYLAARKAEQPREFNALLDQYAVVYDDGQLVIRSLAARAPSTVSSARLPAASRRASR